jgi:aspartate/methionine/tyrosine aminotransferase
MFARTITLGSLGKAFSCTGYRTGYAIAPKPIMKSLVAGHQHITARVFHPVQPAFARALETGHT